MKRYLLAFIAIALGTLDVMATHMMGADMSYQCLGGGKYKIIAKIYRDCRGIPFNSPTTGATASGCSSASLPMTRTRIRDITPVCASASNPCNPTNTTSGEGVEEHTYEATIDLTQNPWANFKANNCCEITFFVGQCCRNGAITTGQSSQDFMTSCMLNICEIGRKCNSSPTLSNEPVAYLCCNQPFYFNNGAIDTADFDSLAYSLVTGMQSLTNPVSYGSGFSPTVPMTPFCPQPGVKNCTPVPSANPPRGFFLDRLTGDIIFTPTDCSEVGIVVIQIDEYRRDSATKKWELIGVTRRDMQLIVKNCGPNNPPEIKGSNSYSVCEGDKLCFTMDGTDKQFTPHQTRPDTVQMRWNRGIPGATFEIKNPKDREKKAEFCWQTRIGQASDVFYTFTVTAQDDNCPRPATAIRGFRIKVKKRAIAKRKYDVLKCGKFAYKSEPEPNFKGNPLYRWEIRDSTNTRLVFPISFKQLDTIQFKQGGKFIITHMINNPENCPTIYMDTVVIPPVLKAELAFGPDTFACYGDKITFAPDIRNGPSPYRYYWATPHNHRSGDTTVTFDVTVTRDSTIALRIRDANGCVDEDTILVYMKPLPIVNLGPDQRICTYENTVFDAEHMDTVRYLWEPTNDTTRTIRVNVKGTYKVTVQEKNWGCIGKDEVELFVNDTVVSLAGPDIDLCDKDTITITAGGRPTSQTLNFTWTNISQNIPLGTNRNIRVHPRSNTCYDLYLRVNQGGHWCEDRDTFCITVVPLPDMSASLPARCYDYGDRNLGQETGLDARHGAGVTFKSRTSPGLVILNGNTYLYKTTNIDNATLQGGNFRRDRIISEFKDPKTGCFNKDSFWLVTQGNPIVRLRDRTYCQDKGCALMDSSIILPRVKTGALYNWNAFKVPAGVDRTTIIRDLNQGTGLPANFQFCFGDVTEDFYSGEYQMAFFIQDAITGCFTRDTTRIDVVPEPVAEVQPLPQVCLDDDTIDLNEYVLLNGKPMPLDGRWIAIAKDGDRTDSRLATAVRQGRYFIPATGNGDWEFKYEHTATGCLTADSGTLVVKSLPRITLPANMRVCSIDPPITLTPTFVSPTGGSGNWTGVRLSGAENGVFTPGSDGLATFEGPHKFIYTYTDPFSCKMKDSMYITVQSMPSITINTSDPSNICNDQTLNINSTLRWSPGVRWTSAGDGSFSAQDTNTIYQPGPADITAERALLRVANVLPPGNVCPAVNDSMVVLIHPYPQFDFAGDTLQGCEPLLVNFNHTLNNVIPASQLAYFWDFGNGDTSTLANPSNILFANWGKYDVTLTITNTPGPCATTLRKPSYIDVWPVPNAMFTSNPNSYTTIALPKFQFFNQSRIADSSILRYNWNFGTGTGLDTSTQRDPAFSYGKDTNTYEVRLIAISDKGCRDTAYRMLKVGPDIIVYIPNAFTPDDAGPNGNNTFKVYIENFTSYKMHVFNRWGEKMFESTDVNQGWNGRANGQDCQQDVYAYLVEVTSFEGKLYKFTGTITLLR